MKFTGIIASLAVAGLASAAAIPRDTTVTTSAVDSTLAQLNTVISSVQSTVGGIVGNVNGVVNLDGLSSRKLWLYAFFFSTQLVCPDTIVRAL
jgi:hypothetical protein